MRTSAFPHDRLAVPDGDKIRHTPASPGMSLRDYYAGQALNGWFASMQGADFPKDTGMARMAKMFYEMADNMLTERDPSK